MQPSAPRKDRGFVGGVGVRPGGKESKRREAGREKALISTEDPGTVPL